jgi:hypothetical protein
MPKWCNNFLWLSKGGDKVIDAFNSITNLSPHKGHLLPGVTAEDYLFDVYYRYGQIDFLTKWDYSQELLNYLEAEKGIAFLYRAEESENMCYLKAGRLKPFGDVSKADLYYFRETDLLEEDSDGFIDFFGYVLDKNDLIEISLNALSLGIEEEFKGLKSLKSYGSSISIKLLLENSKDDRRIVIIRALLSLIKKGISKNSKTIKELEMGYTHYFNIEKSPSEENWSSFKVEVESLIENAPKHLGVEIKGPTGGGLAVVTEDSVRFNGDREEDLDFETFAVDRDNSMSGFCKTGHRPYDTVVCAVLLSAKQWLDADVSSDGEGDDWIPGMQYYQKVVLEGDIDFEKLKSALPDFIIQ